ncbi:MAG: hypothetical protein WD278_17200 [Pirellulales bacterium]
MKKKHCLCVVAVVAVLAPIGAFIAAWMTHDDFSPEFLGALANATPQEAYRITGVRTSPDLSPPVRLQADGEPINIGKLSNIAHAGPWIADVDGDGDRDLLVGDFPGYFWLFENKGTEEKPVYTSKGKLQAGGEDAKTPVY